MIRRNLSGIPLMPSIFFVWCLLLPTAVLIFTLAVIWLFTGSDSNGILSLNMINDFLRYYDRHRLDEGMQIFLNNYLAVLVVVYFTPATLWLRHLWHRYRSKKETAVTTFEKIILYLFPAFFLVRQAINIAVVTGNLSFGIGKNLILTLAGIILPHGLPELLVFSLAGAVGMEFTRGLLSAKDQTRLISAKLLGLLMLLTAGCAFVEVYFTPKVFALLMT